MTERMQLAVEITMENGQFKAEIVNTAEATKKVGETGKEAFGAVGEAARFAGGPVGSFTGRMQQLLTLSSRTAVAMAGVATAVATYAAAMLKGSQIAGEHEREMNRLRAQVQATGMAAGRTADQLDEQSQALARSTLFGDNEIRKAQGILLTFRSVSGEFFDQTLRTAADLAEIMGTDLSSAVLQLGKALEDPEQGLTALTRSGVSFNATQKETIKGFVESGQKGKALEAILRTVNDQLGPAATAAADGYAGAMHRVAESWEDFLEALQQTDTMQWWLDKIDRALQGLRVLVAETEREEFNRLFAERQRLKDQNSNFSANHPNVVANNQRVAELDARLTQLQDNEVARQRGATAAGAGGGGGASTGGGPTEAQVKEAEKLQKEWDEQSATVAEYELAMIAARTNEREETQAVIDKYDEQGTAQRQLTADMTVLQEQAAKGDERAIAALNAIADGSIEASDSIVDATTKSNEALDAFADQAARNIQNIGVALLRGRAIGESFFDTMLNGLADLAAELAVQAALRALFSSMAGSSIGWVSSLGAALGATVAHTGGVMGQDSLPTRTVPAFAFAGAPRYHTGMISSLLGPNERPAILQDDESVLTPAQMRAMGGRRGSIVINNNVDARGGTQAAQIVAMHAALRENNRQLIDHLQQMRHRGDL